VALVVARGVSLINKMLQDLDRRQALGAGADSGVARPAAANPQHREWFWRIVTVLLVVGVGWVLWTAYQLLPRPLVTPLAFFAAEEARARPKPPAIKIEIPVQPPAPPVVVAAPVTAESPRAATPPAAEPLKLAQEIETPVREPAPAPAAKTPREPRAKPVAAAPARQPSVDKRDHARTPNDTAETHFRRAALFLNHGRVAEAEDQLTAALKADPSHAAARQAYVALLLERQRVDAARRVLQEGLAIDPGQPAFALTLARIHTAQRDYRAAIEVLDRAGTHEQNPEFQAMRGAVLQRLARDPEAIEAFQAAIRGGAQPAATWVNLAISLETIGRKAEAVAAYRKALTAGPLPAEAREYAQARARALE
jgi:MSHA biogenesis protein MshN